MREHVVTLQERPGLTGLVTRPADLRAVCSCGWRSISLMSRPMAEAHGRDHVATETQPRLVATSKRSAA